MPEAGEPSIGNIKDQLDQVVDLLGRAAAAYAEAESHIATCAAPMYKCETAEADLHKLHDGMEPVGNRIFDSRNQAESLNGELASISTGTADSGLTDASASAAHLEETLHGLFSQYSRVNHALDIIRSSDGGDRVRRWRGEQRTASSELKEKHTAIAGLATSIGTIRERL